MDGGQRPGWEWLTPRARALLPAVLIIVIGLTNRVVVATTDLTPWDLGGFGMYSTIDAPRARVVRLTGEAPTGQRIVLRVDSTDYEEIQRLQVMPSRARARAVADRLVRERWIVNEGEATPGFGGELITAIEVEVGRIDYDPDRRELVYQPLASSGTAR